MECSFLILYLYSPIECFVCRKTFTSRRNMKRHKDEVHDKVVVYECELCGHNCGTFRSVKRHFVKKHPKQTFNARSFKKEHKADVAKELEEVIANMDDDLGEDPLLDFLLDFPKSSSTDPVRDEVDLIESTPRYDSSEFYKWELVPLEPTTIPTEDSDEGVSDPRIRRTVTSETLEERICLPDGVDLVRTRHFVTEVFY